MMGVSFPVVNIYLIQGVELGSIQVFSRFQLESTKLGRDVVFQVTVFEKKERGRRRLFAETQCSDPLQYLVQFVIRDAADLGGVISRFVEQLVHRGYTPYRYRLRLENDTWDEWMEIEIE